MQVTSHSYSSFSQNDEIKPIEKLSHRILCLAKQLAANSKYEDQRILLSELLQNPTGADGKKLETVEVLEALRYLIERTSYLYEVPDSALICYTTRYPSRPEVYTPIPHQPKIKLGPSYDPAADRRQKPHKLSGPRPSFKKELEA